MFVLFFASIASATEPSAITTALDACLAGPEGQSQVGMLACTKQATDAWTAAVDKAVDALSARLPTAEREQLRRSQDAWKAYRDQDLVLVDAMTKRAEGSLYQLNAAGERLTITRQRAELLQSHLAYLVP